LEQGVRVAEIVALEWKQVDLYKRLILIERLGGGSAQELHVQEIADLVKLRGAFPDSTYVFCSERKGPLTRRTVHAIVSRAGQLAHLPFTVNPQMLRYADCDSPQ
jgi:site-specific recombinase XerD